MTELKKDDLKSRFKNGALPREEDFAALIEALVHKDEFNEWTKQGELELGSRDGKWRLRVEDNTLIAERGDGPAVLRIDAGDPDTPAVLGAAALAATQGRVGTYAPGDGKHLSSIDAVTTGLNLLSVKADGNWQPIIQTLPGCGAFEIVAHMGWNGEISSDSTPDVAKGDVLLSLLGLTRPDSAMLHAIALNPAPGTRPSLQQTSAPGRRGWRAAIRDLCWLGLISSGFLLWRSRIVGCKDGQTLVECAQNTLGQLVGQMPPLALLGLVISVVGLIIAWRSTRQDLRLEWRRQASSALSPHARYDLYLRGHARRGSGDEKIHYHVSRLW